MPRMDGYVTFSFLASPPTFFPVSSLLPSTSSISSAIWKASPMASPYRVIASSSLSPAFFIIAPALMLASINSPVLCMCIYSSTGNATSFPSDSMSSTWPPTMPVEPAALAISCMVLRRSSLSSSALAWVFAITSNADVRRASPASIAIASPNTLWHVGMPRLISSLSMAGRSSCMSE